MRTKLLISIATLVLAAFALAACGGDDESTTAAAESTSSETEATSSGGGETVSFEADPDGALAYTETSVTAAAGDATIAFDNPSTTAHNVVIEDEGGTIAETEIVTGDSATAAATFEPGTYAFYCSVGSHRAAGMEGELTVE